MGAPIIDLILEAWREDLESISVATGYNTDVTGALRLVDPPTDARGATVNFEGLKEEKEAGNPVRTVRALVLLRLVLPNDHHHPERDILKFAADVERKSEEGLGRRHPSVISTQILEQEVVPVEAGDRVSECLQTYRVVYRHPHGLPEGTP